jgi:hypothetical protein
MTTCTKREHVSHVLQVKLAGTSTFTQTFTHASFIQVQVLLSVYLHVWTSPRPQLAAWQHLAGCRWLTMHFIWSVCCVPVYGVPLNHESKTEDILFFVFLSVSRDNAVNVNAPPLLLRWILGKQVLRMGGGWTWPRFVSNGGFGKAMLSLQVPTPKS